MKVIAEFKECPDCKVDARLMDPIIQEEIAKGNMSKDVLSCASADITFIIDPKHPPITGGRVAGARVLRDICIKCGRTYTVRIDRGYVTLPTRAGMPVTFT